MAEHDYAQVRADGCEHEHAHDQGSCHDHTPAHGSDHDHGLDHAHDHDHGHGHDHAHEHDHEGGHNHRESFEIADAEVFTESHMHEQAATVSLAICPNEGCTYAFDALVERMKEIAAHAEAAGGIIGHIKAFAREEGGPFAHASITQADLPPTCEGDVTAAFGAEADIQLVAIVLLIGWEELLAICRDALAS